MEHRPHIHRGKFSQAALLQLQPILEEMAKGAGAELLQPGHTVFQNLAIERPGDVRAHRPAMVLVKSRFQEQAYFLPPGVLCHIPLAKPPPSWVYLPHLRFL